MRANFPQARESHDFPCPLGERSRLHRDSKSLPWNESLHLGCVALSWRRPWERAKHCCISHFNHGMKYDQKFCKTGDDVQGNHEIKKGLTSTWGKLWSKLGPKGIFFPMYLPSEPLTLSITHENMQSNLCLEPFVVT